jgi:hypothetical protein
MVFAFAGDSTITKCLPDAPAPFAPPELRVRLVPVALLRGLRALGGVAEFLVVAFALPINSNSSDFIPRGASPVSVISDQQIKSFRPSGQLTDRGRLRMALGPVNAMKNNSRAH